MRLFSYWYEMDVVDGEALVQWRDDTSQAYPGKGKALFEVISDSFIALDSTYIPFPIPPLHPQVNHWLTLVEEAEEAESSEED